MKRVEKEDANLFSLLETKSLSLFYFRSSAKSSPSKNFYNFRHQLILTRVYELVHLHSWSLDVSPRRPLISWSRAMMEKRSGEDLEMSQWKSLSFRDRLMSEINWNLATSCGISAWRLFSSFHLNYPTQSVVDRFINCFTFPQLFFSFFHNSLIVSFLIILSFHDNPIRFTL